jgi:hypothetical protein
MRGKRKRYSAEFKAKVALDVTQPPDGDRQDLLLHQDDLRDEQALRLVEVYHHGAVD